MFGDVIFFYLILLTSKLFSIITGIEWVTVNLSIDYKLKHDNFFTALYSKSPYIGIEEPRYTISRVKKDLTKVLSYITFA